MYWYLLVILKFNIFAMSLKIKSTTMCNVIYLPIGYTAIRYKLTKTMISNVGFEKLLL